MAQLICDLDHVELGAFIIGHISDGAQVVLCDSCLIPWMLTMLEERLTPETRVIIADHIRDGASGQAEPPSPESKPPPKRRGRQTPAAEAETPPAAQVPAPTPPDGC